MPPAGATENEFQRGQLCLARQGQYDHLRLVLLLLLDEVVDRLLVELVVQGQQVRVQHEQISPHVHHILGAPTAIQS